MSEILTTESGVHISSEGKFISPEAATDVVALLESSDYYLAYPPQRPKTEIADYVESCGFRVPKRYKNLEAALESGEDFIMRSEHPQDYDGVSGLFESEAYYMPNPIVSRESVLSDQKGILDIERVKEYCKGTGKNYDEFISQSSFEYWKYKDGNNFTVVRDEVVEGRYHIFHNEGGGSDYICYEFGNLIQGSLPSGVAAENVEDLISQYERIAMLPRFDSFQCPNIEFQLEKDKQVSFLQYKRGHQKDLHSWTLDRELEEGEIEADFVRGMTKVGGEKQSMRMLGAVSFYVPEDLEIIGNYDLIFSTKIPIVIGLGDTAGARFGYHTFVAHIVHSGLYIAIPGDFIATHEVVRLLTIIQIQSASQSIMAEKFGKKEKKDVFLKRGLDMCIESDGSRGIVRILTTFDELLDEAVDKGFSKERILEQLESYRDMQEQNY